MHCICIAAANSFGSSPSGFVAGGPVCEEGVDQRIRHSCGGRICERVDTSECDSAHLTYAPTVGRKSSGVVVFSPFTSLFPHPSLRFLSNPYSPTRPPPLSPFSTRRQGGRLMHGGVLYVSLTQPCFPRSASTVILVSLSPFTNRHAKQITPYRPGTLTSVTLADNAYYVMPDLIRHPDREEDADRQCF